MSGLSPRHLIINNNYFVCFYLQMILQLKCLVFYVLLPCQSFREKLNNNRMSRV